MKADLRWHWKRLSANYWFYPALFSIGAAVLASVLVWADRAGAGEFIRWNKWLIPSEPTSASDMLTVMAGSMIGVASTVFSITIAAVAYASGSFGPRLLTNFLEDKGNQLSLATFIASFVYAIVTLRAVREGGESALESAADAFPGQAFVPQLSLLVAYLLIAVSVGVLVYFLNHIPTSIQINEVIKNIARQLLDNIKEQYPSEQEPGPREKALEGTQIAADETGYIRLIDYEGLRSVAKELDARIGLAVRTGDFVHPGIVLVEAQGVSEEHYDTIRGCFSLGATRSAEQDTRFLIDELVEISLRALSPGINDPFTAINAIHWLGAATAELAKRDLRPHLDTDGGEDRRVVPLADSFDDFLDRSFDALRSGVAAAPLAAEATLQTIGNIVGVVADESRCKALLAQADSLVIQARLALEGPDLSRVERARAALPRA